MVAGNFVDGWSEAEPIAFGLQLLKNDGFRFAPAILRDRRDLKAASVLGRDSLSSGDRRAAHQ